jgi:hypothetical protein
LDAERAIAWRAADSFALREFLGLELPEAPAPDRSRNARSVQRQPDSNVILDVVSEDAEWGDWSASMLSKAAQAGRLVINPLIYAEVSCGFEQIEDLDEAVPAEYFVREPLPWDAAFLAARAFLKYRRRGGTRSAPLPDFYLGTGALAEVAIGAHAALAGYTLLTRDRRRYSTYFPKLQIIAP